ncbi:MAG TPA: DUF2252 family protein [Ferruginibacter sp.]|jgi:uncharacterized protein (DUF2252 family)|nr:DUF2252 family protein [Ferruginibacter sp.]
MEILSKRINEFNKGRLPDMVALKYKAMAENMFRFYRGTNHIFYEDLRDAVQSIPASPLTWICGDLHLENFGSFKSDNRQVYFDLNDFDEAVLAPASYELVRIITSIFIAFDSLKIEEKKALNMAQLFLKTYSTTLSKGKSNYIEPKTAKGIVCEFLTAVSKRSSKEVLKKKAVLKKHKLSILLDDPKHFELDKKFKKELFGHLIKWLKDDGDSPYNYKVVDAVFRFAGTGSVGLKRYAILLKTLNETGEKYLLIDMKQAAASSLNCCLKVKQPKWTSEAERIISIQRRMQNRLPALLSTTIFKGEPFIIQEMQPFKDSINFKMIKENYRNIFQVIDDMAMLTASSQLRSSGRQGSATADELIAFGQHIKWQESIIQYASQYAVKVKTDYAIFLKDYKKGCFERLNRN